MTSRFDNIIFLISTDCFADELFTEYPAATIECVKQAARAAIPHLLDGGDNYYLYADFSPARAEQTRRAFFADLQARHLPSPLQHKIERFYQVLLGLSAEVSSAASIILSVTARLYWLDTDDFNVPVTPALLDTLSIIEPLGLNVESHGYEWEDAWLNSTSDWDRYVMSLMDGIKEVPYLTFVQITAFSPRFDGLRAWKHHLGAARFSEIEHVIRAQAHAELAPINAAAAREIDRLLAQLG